MTLNIVPSKRSNLHNTPTVASGSYADNLALASPSPSGRSRGALYPKDDADAVKPIVRWAGGKRWLLPVVRSLAAKTSASTLIEPFLGGAATALGVTSFQSLDLTDLNSELVAMYREVRDRPGEVHDAYRYWTNSSEQYYLLRDAEEADPILAAARFLYLNHTSFNGIYRVNRQGKYNVPYGRRKALTLPTLDHLQAASKRLGAAHIAVGDFEESINRANSGTFVFVDPPYTVAHNNNGFIKYNQHLFSFDDQKRLAGAIERAVGRGAFFALTNAAHSSIRELFGNLGRIVELDRKNTVGGLAAGRGRTSELLFTNVA